MQEREARSSQTVPRGSCSGGMFFLAWSKSGFYWVVSLSWYVLRILVCIQFFCMSEACAWAKCPSDVSPTPVQGEGESGEVCLGGREVCRVRREGKWQVCVKIKIFTSFPLTALDGVYKYN